MKKYICSLFITGCCFISNVLGNDFFVEATAAYYCPTGHEFRTIYSGSGIYGLELNLQAWRGLYVWTNVNIFSKLGRTDESDTKTHLFFVPVSVGLKYL